jgi:hypothetical protein
MILVKGSVTALRAGDFFDEAQRLSLAHVRMENL